MKERVVGLGEIVITDDPEVVLTVPGIGSCVIVCLYQRRAGVAAMAHIVLPSSQGRKEAVEKPFWFADLAVPYLLKEMTNRGAFRPNCAIVGGANVLPVLALPTSQTRVAIGDLNIKAVLEHLNGSVQIVAKLVGGSKGMVVRLQVADGTLLVKDKDGQIQTIAL